MALLGPNGAGKSSLVRTIAGLLPKFEGRVLDGKVRLFGREATHLDPVGISRLGLTAILEGRPLFRYLTPVENLMAAGHRLPPKALKEGMEEVFARFPRLYDRRHDQAATSRVGSSRCSFWAWPSSRGRGFSWLTSPPWASPPSWWERLCRPWTP